MSWSELLTQQDTSEIMSVTPLSTTEKSTIEYSFAEQFKVIKFRKGNDDKDLSINGVCPYLRVLVRRKI